MGFEVIPAIDLRRGRCVQLVQGKKNREIVSLPNPVEIAGKWIDEGAEILHIIDLDGAFQEKNNNRGIIIKIIEKYGVRIQAGGGIRSYEDAKSLLDLGVERVILGTAAIKNPEIVGKLSREFLSERIFVALDSRKGEVMMDGWRKGTGFKTEDLALKFQNIGAGGILFTNIDVEGLLSGINIEPVRNLIQKVDIPVIVAGGIAFLEEIKMIREVGAGGVVIGSALYKGRISLRDALNL
ncbi:MAG: 1-(5-phosphoribosyl)-5-[(5-phosphoribosylamino)methylideneamino]imidazole-4-carboxamide isomerase [Candidatus Syntropharchaeia archaeon]